MLGLLSNIGLLLFALVVGACLGHVARGWLERRAKPVAAGPQLTVVSVEAPPSAREANPLDCATVAHLAGISHELRTPINGVLAIADVLNRTGLSPQQQALVAVMLNSGKAVNEVLNRLLALTEAAAAPAVAEAPADPDMQPQESNRALIVDDNAINRQVIELILDSAGIEHLSVENGLEAVEAARKERFPVVLMDLQMPVMDGFEATRRIRELEARRGGPRASIIVVSANCFDEDIAAGREAGADDHMAKPISAAALIAAICDPAPERVAA